MVGAYKVLVEKPEETRTRRRRVIIANWILKSERCVRADTVLLAQNSSHWRVLVNTEVYLHSFLHCELDGVNISFTTRCPSNRKLDGLQGRAGPCGEEIILSPLSRVEPQFLGCPAHGLVSTPTTL